MLYVKRIIPPDVHKLADLCILNFLAVQTWLHLVSIRFLFNYNTGLERPSIHMEDIIIKQEDQTVWYENDELIKEYLESSKKSPKKKAVNPEDKLSFLKLIKKSMATPSE